MSSHDGPAAILRLTLDVSGVTGADTSGGLGSVYFSTTGPAQLGHIKVADFALSVTHGYDGAETTALEGEFYVKD
jgi:hypothetical protein